MAKKEVKKEVKKKVTIEEVESPKETTPEIVEKKSEEVKVRNYDELVALPREEFLKVQADIKAWKAKIKPID